MRLTFLSFAALLIISACNSSPPKVVAPEPVGPRNEVFQDVPFPPHMKYVSGEGNIRPDNRLRVYRMELRGARNIDEITAFFQEALPQHGWKFQEARGAAPEPVLLLFHKDLEKLSIDLKKESELETLCVLRIDYAGGK